MIQIYSHTTKTEILKRLAEESAKSGVLYLKVNSVPHFLATNVAFIIFSYQLKNYPRELVWFSDDLKILDFLKICGLNVLDNTHKDGYRLATNVTASNNNLSNIHKNQNYFKSEFGSLGLGGQNTELISTSSPKTDQINHRKIFDIKKQDSQSEPVPLDHSDKPQKQYKKNTFEPNFLLSEEKLSIKNLITHKNYIQSKLLQDKNTIKYPLVLGNKSEIQKQENRFELHFDKNNQRENQLALSSDTAKNTVRIKENNDLLENFLEKKPSKENIFSWGFGNLVSNDKNASQNGKTNFDPAFFEELPDLNINLDNSKNGFDVWLKRVEKTKKNLRNNNFKKGTFASGYVSYGSVRNFNLNNPKTNWLNNVFELKAINSFGWIWLSFLISFLSVFSFLFSPTQVYTLQLDTITKTAKSSFIIDKSKLNYQTTTLEDFQETEATGTKEIKLNRSIGSVDLINPSGNQLLLTNGGFKMINQGRRYNNVYDSNLPNTLQVPARGKLTVRMQAAGSGDRYNLDKNVRSLIFNLNEDQVCGSCYAIVTSEIKNVAISDDRFVTEVDQDKLRQNAKLSLSKKATDELQKINQKEDRFAAKAWTKVTILQEKFVPKVGDKTDKLSLTTQARLDIAFVNKSYLAELILKNNSQIDQIKNIQISEPTDKNSDPFSDISLELEYTFVPKVDLKKAELIQKIDPTDFENAQKNLKQTYPEINKVDKQESGVKLPWIPYRVDVNINRE